MQKAFRFDTAFVFLSFGVFAASMLVVLMFGANVYRGVVEKSYEVYNERVCLSYIWTKVKTGDSAGNIYIEEFNGLPSLCIEEEYEGVTYKTSIYWHDGWAYELFTQSGNEFLPEDGMPVLETEALEFELLDGGLIRVKANTESLFIFPRGGMSVGRPAV